MGNLDKALAELAERLGVGVDELWSFLTDGGLQSYTSMCATRAGIAAAVSLLFAAVCIVAARWAYMRNRGRAFLERSDGADVVLGISVGLAALAFVAFAINATECATWALFPDGMLIEMFVGALR